MMNDSRQAEKDNLIMKIARKAGLFISREAAMIMLEDGILTEELPLEQYILIHNIDTAIDQNNPDRVLGGIYQHPDWAEDVKGAFLECRGEIEAFLKEEREEWQDRD